MNQRKCIIFFIAFAYITAFDVSALDCYECENCSDLTNIKPQVCKTNEALCFTSISDGKLTRGCIEDESKCSSENCVTCKDRNGCNDNNVCQKCESSSTSSCLNLNIQDWKSSEICTSANAQCLINIKSDKTTERRCATASDTCKGDTCKLCSGGNCNVGVFPANRIECYQCTAESKGCENLNNANYPINPGPCALYDAEDKCYMIGTDSSQITRGCVSDLKNDKCKADKPNERCYTCDKSSCNKFSFKRNQSLKCIQCNDNGECFKAQKESDAKNCKNEIEYWTNENCYTQLLDGKINRGCYYDRESSLGECTTAKGCETCSNADGCNNKEQQFSCIRCRSDNNPNCYDHADKIGGEKCREEVTDHDSKCFHGIWNGVVIRGCLVDGDPRTQALCNDEKSKQCITCVGKDCNSQKTSGASSSSAAAIIITLCFAILVRMS